MAVLNIRVDDQVRDELKDMADAEGVTVSEYVRDLLTAALVPGYESKEDHGDLPAPETMRRPGRPSASLASATAATTRPPAGTCAFSGKRCTSPMHATSPRCARRWSSCGVVGKDARIGKFDPHQPPCDTSRTNVVVLTKY